MERPPKVLVGRGWIRYVPPQYLHLSGGPPILVGPGYWQSQHCDFTDGRLLYIGLRHTTEAEARAAVMAPDSP